MWIKWLITSITSHVIHLVVLYNFLIAYAPTSKSSVLLKHRGLKKGEYIYIRQTHFHMSYQFEHQSLLALKRNGKNKANIVNTITYRMGETAWIDKHLTVRCILYLNWTKKSWLSNFEENQIAYIRIWSGNFMFCYSFWMGKIIAYWSRL